MIILNLLIGVTVLLVVSVLASNFKILHRRIIQLEVHLSKRIDDLNATVSALADSVSRAVDELHLLADQASANAGDAAAIGKVTDRIHELASGLDQAVAGVTLGSRAEW